MSSAEMKQRILREINSLDKKALQEAYGVLLNFFNSKEEEAAEWNKLTKKQKEGILKAAKQLDNRKGISHKRVMTKYRKRYNA